MNSATSPEEALRKAKVNLLTKEGGVFISTIVTQLEYKMSDKVPTAGTNGTIIYFNPEFLMSLSPKERVGLLAHEAWHVAFNHMAREGNRNHEIWNIAGDYVINELLVSNGFTLPPGGLYDPAFHGLATEQIYEILIRDAVKIPVNFLPDLMPPNKDNSEETINIINKATISARLSDAYNNLPLEIVREIDKLLFPRISWVDQLQRYLDTRAKEDISWRSPNKKYLPSYILPSRHSKTLDKVTIAIDTSGSITSEVLNSILSEIQAVNQAYSITELTVIDCDCKINNIYSVKPYDNVYDLTFTGGGGTSAKPVLNYIKQFPTDLLIYFTDGFMKLDLEEPDCSTLWGIYENPSFIAPFGETIFIT